MRHLQHRLLAIVAISFALAPKPAEAQKADPDPARFEREIAAFAQWDSKNSAPIGATVFVGSSSIRFWPTADRFPGMPLINRGFGGAHVHAVLPATQIVFVAVKPSLARWELWPQMIELNERVKKQAEQDERLRYADIATPMLGPDGEPMPQLFVSDGLHMTPAGYNIWTEVLGRMAPGLRIAAYAGTSTSPPCPPFRSRSRGRSIRIFRSDR